MSYRDVPTTYISNTQCFWTLSFIEFKVNKTVTADEMLYKWIYFLKNYKTLKHYL
jgi:hypothetical protein